MMKFILITIFMHFSHGESVDFLINSQTMKELMLKDAQQRKRMKIKGYCQSETQANHFPTHCFMELQSSVNYGMSQEYWQSEKHRLNTLCLNDSKKLNSLVELAGVLQSPLLTKECKASLEERRLDLIYIHEKGLK